MSVVARFAACLRTIVKPGHLLFASLLLFLASNAFPRPAEAAEKRGKPKRELITNRQLIDAESDNLEAAEKKMDAAYAQLLGVLDDTGKATLKEAQDKWLAWREAQAEFDSHHLAGGKLRPMEAQGSRTGTTKARTTRLLEDYKRFKEMFSSR